MNGCNAGIDGSFLGLGFSHGGGENEATPTSTPSNTADSLMKHYLQQCLEFHDEQQQQHEIETSAPQFVIAQHPPAPPPIPAEAPPPYSDGEPPTSITVVTTEQKTSATSSVSDPLSHPSAQEAVAKAQAIVQKFQQQQHQFPPMQPHDEHASSSDYRYRRQQQLEKEQERLHKATLKNFAYVAKREEARLQQQLAQLQETRVLEQQLHQQQASMLQNRQALSKAGIGTARRQALEEQKKRKGNVAKMNDDLSVAIYVSGLPTTITEDFLKQLFESYGAMRRVHLYRDKQTGELKGDALVVYNVRKVTEKQDILDAACSQMSGAELPCGSILRVEPADPQYKQRQSEQKKSTKCDEDVGHYGPASGESTTEIPKKEVVEVNVSSTKGNGDENNQDDDLDDFFDSL